MNFEFHAYAEIFPLIDDEGVALALKENRASVAPWLSKDQRAMLAAEIWQIQRGDSRLRSAAKDKWIREARKSFRPGDQRNCAVCDRYSSVTHAHHIFPLWMQFDAGLSTVNNDFVWLCPAHHSGVHLFLQKKSSWPNTSGFTSEEQEALIRIALPAASWKPEISNAA